MKYIDEVGRYKRDLKKCVRRGYDLKKLDKIIVSLLMEKTLPARARPHKLLGNYIGHWECHIQPDWLLIYRTSADTLFLVRTGTHSDLL
ncbi:MAG: type II toxin-antitoxin system YafQ family toxin [Alphaproteobacteria bacterium]|nr:type II toxin-antitoxin system YafQ family toxin [Alphaproteobacteria bacterium]MBE8220804.1 type II toxin-antitoxin system YafQ family toxin [Alphaproteobacteria bacterium]